MASFKAFGRNQGPRRSQGHRNERRYGRPSVEFLETRRLLTTTMGPNAIPAPLWTPTSTNLYDTEYGPMANLGTDLISVYKSFYTSGGNTAQLAGQFPLIYFQNGMVGVQVKSLGGDFSQFATQLTDLGMQVTAASSYYGLVQGCAPVSALPNIAQLPQTEAGSPLYKPYVNAEYQGIAYNEAETSLFRRRCSHDFQRRRYRCDARRALRQRQSVQRRPLSVVCHGGPEPQ